MDFEPHVRQWPPYSARELRLKRRYLREMKGETGEGFCARAMKWAKIFDRLEKDTDVVMKAGRQGGPAQIDRAVRRFLAWKDAGRRGFAFWVLLFWAGQRKSDEDIVDLCRRMRRYLSFPFHYCLPAFRMPGELMVAILIRVMNPQTREAVMELARAIGIDGDLTRSLHRETEQTINLQSPRIQNRWLYPLSDRLDESHGLEEAVEALNQMTDQDLRHLGFEALLCACLDAGVSECLAPSILEIIRRLQQDLTPTAPFPFEPPSWSLKLAALYLQSGQIDLAETLLCSLMKPVDASPEFRVRLEAQDNIHDDPSEAQRLWQDWDKVTPNGQSIWHQRFVRTFTDDCRYCFERIVDPLLQQTPKEILLHWQNSLFIKGQNQRLILYPSLLYRARKEESEDLFRLTALVCHDQPEELFKVRMARNEAMRTHTRKGDHL